MIKQEDLNALITARLPEVLDAIPSMTQKGKDAIFASIGECITDADVNPENTTVAQRVVKVGEVSLETSWSNAWDVAKCLHTAMIEEGGKHIVLECHDTVLTCTVDDTANSFNE